MPTERNNGRDRNDKNDENADSGIRESLVAGPAFFSILEMKFDGRFVILEKCSAETCSHTQLLWEGAEIY